MESLRKLYLFNGQTYILVPESAWLTELKSDPTGINVLKAVDDSFLTKGWVKLRFDQDPKSHASESEWLFEETGARIRISVDPAGQLKVDGTPIGSTSIGETYKQIEKVAEDKTGKWITVQQEITGEGGQKILAPRKVFIPAEKIRKPPGFEPGKDAKKPGDVTRIGPEKGGPHPTSDVLGFKKFEPWLAMNQVLGIYSPSIIKVEPTKQEILQQCNRLLELAEQEKNEEERARLCEEVSRQLRVLEACEKSASKKITLEKAKEIGAKLAVDFSKFNLEEFQIGLKEELEHKDVTGGDLVETGKIALSHLKEDPKYYSKLKKVIK